MSDPLCPRWNFILSTEKMKLFDHNKCLNMVMLGERPLRERTQPKVKFSLFKEEGGSSLYPSIGVWTAGETDVRHYLHPLWACV